MRAPTVQRIWLHDHDFGRDAGGADRSAPVRRLFLLAARDFGVCVLLVLVFREFSVHRDVYGGCARAGFAARGFGRPRLGNLVRAMGVACRTRKSAERCARSVGWEWLRWLVGWRGGLTRARWQRRMFVGWSRLAEKLSSS